MAIRIPFQDDERTPYTAHKATVLDMCAFSTFFVLYPVPLFGLSSITNISFFGNIGSDLVLSISIFGNVRFLFYLEVFSLILVMLPDWW